MDLYAGDIYNYDFATGKTRSIRLGGTVAPIIQSKSDPNLFIVGLNRSIVALEWDGVSAQSKTRVLATVAQDYPDTRFNDGKADNQGRLWIGTSSEEKLPDGSLFEVTRDNLSKPSVVISPVTTGNGLTWNKANNRFFYNDSPTRIVMAYDYNDEEGTISNGLPLFNLEDYPELLGLPDGMTIDEDDNLYVCLYGGSGVAKINSETGELLEFINIPARDVASIMWGGSNLDVLFVTSGKRALTEEEREQLPLAGSVFMITGLGAKGVPVYQVDLIDSIDD